jgi:glucokinase
MNQSSTHYHLAGDIGGTKTLLGLYDSRQGPLFPVDQITVQNNTVSGLEDIVRTFLGRGDILPATACFGIAGPIADNRVRMTNLDWVIDGRKLQRSLGIGSVFLINDLVATAMGAVTLPKEKLLVLNEGHPDNGAMAVIAPGTGLGEAFLVRHRNCLLPFPSEGGHCSFAPVDDLQMKLLRYMAEKRDHVSYEQVCSGIGIPNIYDFLLAGVPENARPALPEDDDRTRAIVEAALQAKQNTAAGNRAAAQALELFIAILASEAANLVLKVLGTGGLFIGGGIPPRILPYLAGKTFMAAFCKGIYRDMLADIPVQVILEPDTALIGAAAYSFALHGHSGEHS